MNEIDNEDVIVQDELTTLKERATLMGLKFHPSISLDKLREKVNAANDASAAPAEDEKPVAVETLNQKRTRLKNEALALVRIRLTCMNPAKAEWDGEIFTIGNALLGSVKKFVPFNADDGWHVPTILLQQLQERQCQVFVSAKDARGNNVRRGKLIKEFAIEILPPLTKTELDELARRQAMSKAID